MATNMMCDNSKALSGSDYKRKSGERTNGFSYVSRLVFLFLAIGIL
jgi:hypothetical protein